MAERIKILHLTGSLAVGGAEQFIINLAGRTDPDRFDIHICYMGAPRSNSLQHEFERLNLPLYITGSRKLYNPVAALAISRYILEHKIDIIHTHLILADITGRIIGQWLDRPVVSTLQNEPHNYNQARFDQRWLERLTARYLSPRLVAVSKHVRTMFVEQWHIPEEKIEVIYNAVAMAPYLAIPEGPNRNNGNQGPLIINVASLSEQKAQARLLEAAKLVLAECPDARFMIVGRGRLEQKLKDYARRLGIAEQVIFTGLRHDIPDLLAQADIFVLSSLWEGLPLAAVEAMAAARPVILTDVGGNSELVKHGQTGLLAPPGDVEALAGAIRSLLRDLDWRRALGKAARAQVRHDFNIEVVVKQYETLYESLLKEHSLGQIQPESGLERGHEEAVQVSERVYNE